MSDEQKDPVVFAFHQKDGGKLMGVPARSLTQKDVDRMTPDQRREVKASTMYRAVTAGGEKPKDDGKGGES